MSDQDSEIEFEEDFEEKHEQAGQPAKNDGSQLYEDRIEKALQGAEDSERDEEPTEKIETCPHLQNMMKKQMELLEEKIREEEAIDPHGKSQIVVKGSLNSVTAARGTLQQFSTFTELTAEQEIQRARLSEGKSETEAQKKESQSDEKKIRDIIEAFHFMNLERQRAIDEERRKENEQQHLYFADKIFEFMLNYLGIKCQRENPKEIKGIYKPSIGQAVLSISMLYRDKWREMFKAVKKRLMYHENFPAFCFMVPVEIYGPYFYSVLQRVAIIFEMALFCFDHHCDFFEMAIKCVPGFLDTDFFSDAGDWPRLERAAEIVSTLTLPLRNALGGEKSKLKSFSEVIKELVAYRVIGENSREYSLFQELDEKFQMLSGKARDAETDLLSSAEVSESEKEVLLKYLSECFPADCSKRFHKLDIGKDYILDLEPWIYNAQQQKNRPEVAEMRKRLLESADTDKQSKEKENSKSVRAEAQNVPTEKPGKQTGAIPKRKNKKQQSAKYIFIQTDHVEQLIKVYRSTLPSFLKTHLHKYFIPQLKDKTCIFDCDNACFYVPVDVVKERYLKIKEKTCSQKRLWGECPQGYDCPVPIELERKLDLYIVNKQCFPLTTQMIGMDFFFLGTKSIYESLKRQAWIIKRNLDEVVDPETEGNKAIKELRKSLKIGGDCRSSTAEEDYETVWKSQLIDELADALDSGKETPTKEMLSPKPEATKKKKPRKKRSVRK